MKNLKIILPLLLVILALGFVINQNKTAVEVGKPGGDQQERDLTKLKVFSDPQKEFYTMTYLISKIAPEKNKVFVDNFFTENSSRSELVQLMPKEFWGCAWKTNEEYHEQGNLIFKVVTVNTEKRALEVFSVWKEKKYFDESLSKCDYKTYFNKAEESGFSISKMSEVKKSSQINVWLGTLKDVTKRIRFIPAQ